jgi:truncated hemoglobin YjbI
LSEPKKNHFKKILDDVGSVERLNQILIRFYKSLAEDILLGFFFEGKDLEEIARKQGLFMLRAMGVPVAESVKPPQKAHAQMPPILKGHFDRRKVLLKEVLEQEKISAETAEIWISFEESFRDQVIARP